jgi:cytochrome P450
MSISDPRAAAPTPSASPRTATGPRGHRFFGCMPELARDPLGLYTRAWREHGDIVRLRAIPGVYFFLLVHPDAVEHVLARNHKNYRKPDSFNRPVSLLAGRGLLTDEGPSWLGRRKLIQPAFHRNRLAALDGPVVRETEQMLRAWDRGEDGQVLDVLAEMMHLTLAIAGRTLFSADIGGAADAFGRSLREGFSYVSHRMNHPFAPPHWVPTSRNRRFARARATLKRVVLDLIAERRRGGAAHDDLLAMLMAAQDEETRARMTDQQVRDEALTLLTAGHETVGAALSWTWYLLAQHPEVQRPLQDEVDAALGDRSPTTADLPRLPLCRAAFEEAMRLYPPAWGQPREAIGEDEIDGVRIPARTVVTLAQFLTHRHPEFWDEPEQFRPQRFLGEAPGDRPRFAYFPFGGGPRICIGNQFALIEATLVLATVARRYAMALVPDHPVVPDPTFTLRPKFGVRVVLTRRA